jgi:hypothetical protein
MIEARIALPFPVYEKLRNVKLPLPGSWRALKRSVGLVFIQHDLQLRRFNRDCGYSDFVNQAGTISLNDCFYFIGIALLLSGIAVLFFKKIKATSGAAAH